jgi:hypothetical protein
MAAGYSQKSLVEKLGIVPHSSIAILNAPAGFNLTLGPLPNGVALRSKLGKPVHLVHAFFLNSTKLDLQFPTLKEALEESGALWISWPKRAAKIETDLTENVVREIGLRHGLVDIKVCAVDEVWSGLKFVYRLSERSHTSRSRRL